MAVVHHLGFCKAVLGPPATVMAVLSVLSNLMLICAQNHTCYISTICGAE